jgi:hypothetical protein
MGGLPILSNFLTYLTHELHERDYVRCLGGFFNHFLELTVNNLTVRFDLAD